jgi:predicted RND superfamily exporter protein
VSQETGFFGLCSSHPHILEILSILAVAGLIVTFFSLTLWALVHSLRCCNKSGKEADVELGTVQTSSESVSMSNTNPNLVRVETETTCVVRPRTQSKTTRTSNRATFYLAPDTSSAESVSFSGGKDELLSELSSGTAEMDRLRSRVARLSQVLTAFENAGPQPGQERVDGAPPCPSV